MTAVRIDIRHKSFSSATAADKALITDFQLSLAANEFVCLAGPSGCGKTTLLNLIAGLDQQFTGEIRTGADGRPAKTGYVFQEPRLLPWRTVRQNLELAAEHEPGHSETIDKLLAAMQLSDAAAQYPSQLSLGMSRRAAIIRAFAVNPDLLLMDEPFVSLDAPSARQARALLQELWQQRPHTVLFVTHDLREAITLADRLVFLAPSPMRIAGEVNVSIPRNQRHDEAEIEAFRQTLMAENPNLKPYL
ncbi:MAG: ABC transporter [Methylobacter sp.]|nr:MAG: ABC transporter [Methylobacter sp.]